jgi:hypothetical protein
MAQLSAMFHQKYDELVEKDPSITATAEYREALLYNMLLQTSCFRYWGQGTWTEYAQEIFRRGKEALSH